MRKIQFYVLAFICLLVNACQKNQNVKAGASTASHTNSRPIGIDYPSNINGVLVFKDSLQFGTYMDYLEKSIYSIDSTDTVNDENTILESIERDLNFTSIRKISHDDFTRKNLTGWPSPQDIPKEHFINSIEMRSVLNKDLDFKVGNQLIHFINDKYAVCINDSNSTLIDKYHELGYNATLDDIAAIDKYLTATKLIELTGNGSIFGTTTPQPLGEWHVWYYLNMPYNIPNPCNNPNLVGFNRLDLTWNMNPSQANTYFVVNFGDGSPAQTIYATEYGQTETLPFYHLYPGPGTYTVNVKGYAPNGSGWIYCAQRNDQVVINESCQKIEKSQDWLYWTSGDKGVGGRMYIEFYGGGFFSTPNHKMRLIVETRSIKQNSNGNWSTEKGHISVSAQCSAKDENCNQIDYLQATDSKYKKEFSEHRSKSEKFYWNTATSVHTRNVNGTNITMNRTLSVCN